VPVEALAVAPVGARLPPTPHLPLARAQARFEVRPVADHDEHRRAAVRFRLRCQPVVPSRGRASVPRAQAEGAASVPRNNARCEVRCQTRSPLTQATTAGVTRSLTKWAPAGARESAHPHASPQNTMRARGNRRERSAAAPNAMAAGQLGQASPLLEKGRSEKERNTYSPACAQGRSRR